MSKSSAKAVPVLSEVRAEKLDCGKGRVVEKLEELLDQWALEGTGLKYVHPLRIKALQVRYDKLRGNLQSTELTDKRSTWTDLLQKLADQSVSNTRDEPTQPEPSPEPESESHQPPVTH